MQRGMFYWRAQLCKTFSKKTLSQSALQKIMQEVGKTELGKQEDTARELTMLVQSSENESELLLSMEKMA